MSFSIRCLPAVVLVAVSLPASLWAQSTAKQTSKAPRGSISGRITIKEKGVPGVVVSLRKSDNLMPFGPFQRATTDQDGSYRIVHVAPGSYEVTPSVPAFVPDAKDAVKTKTVLVGEDENVDSINFALVRGGVITGRVTDADGRPVIQQEVNIYQANAFERAAPQQTVFRANAVQTDDRGIYRVYGLPAGRYKVAAGRSDDSYPTFGPSRAVYRQTFHPDASDQAKATVIEVGEATEANNVDIALGRELQTFNATGKVVDATSSLPMPNIRFGLQRIIGQRTEYANTLATSNALGDFVVEGLIPGKYAIYLFPNTAGGMRAEAATFDITDQDVSGVTIKLFKGANLNGVVVLETDDKSALQMLTQLQMRAYVTTPAGSAVGGSSAMSPIGPDGSFTLTGLGGGTVNFNLGGTGMSPFPPKGFIISRIERDGVAVTTRTLEIKESEQVAGVRVFVSYGTGIIRGVVKLENGTMPEGARIFLRVAKGNESPNFIRPPQVDARGYFLMDGLVAGSYEVSATLVGHTGKREVNVQDGIATDVVITIDMSAPPVRTGQPPVIRNP